MTPPDNANLFRLVYRSRSAIAGGAEAVQQTIDAVVAASQRRNAEAGVTGTLMFTGLFFVQALETFRAQRSLWTTCGVEPGSYTLAAGMATSGSLTEWLRELTGGAGFDRLVTEAAATPPGSDGLVVLPYFAGERTPHFDPQARGEQLTVADFARIAEAGALA